MSQQSATPGRENGRASFAELRGLLLGPEQEEIRQLKQSLTGARSAEEISRALPQAVRLAGQRNRNLRAALQPVIEQSIRFSVRHNPGILSDALSPLIGDAVKRAVTSALRQLTESLQETIEQSFTARSLRWRVEAFRSKRPYSEIVLIHSLLYRVEQVFLIHRETGLLLAQNSAQSGVFKDGDLVSSMLTAIQDFVKDSFAASGDSPIDAIEAGEFVIWVQQGSQAILAAMIRGVPPKALKSVFESVLQSICFSHANALASFDGNAGPFHGCKEDLAKCFLGEGNTAKRRVGTWPLWAVAAIVAIILASLLYGPIRERRRWQQAVTALRQEPGIVITESGKRSGKYFVSGLRDPLARDPKAIVQSAGFGGNNVSYNWQTYLSMQQPFAGIRELAEARKRVESRRIHFRSDSAEIAMGELGNVEQTADEIKTLFKPASRAGRNIKIDVIGSADQSGGEQRNAKLSEQRATEVTAALIALGVPSQKLVAAGGGSVVRVSGTADRDRAFSRCVLFRVRVVEP